MVQEILLLGNPLLRQNCVAVSDVASPHTKDVVANLCDTLKDFQQRKGYGRGIAAPQIAVTERIVYVDFEFTGALVNPEIVHRSRATFELWDDCFSFPDLLVRVRRHRGITVHFVDEAGAKQELHATGALSELLQHEIDHINGILAIDHAIDSKHIILRSEFEKLKHRDGRLF